MYSGSMVIFIGIFYILTLVSSLFQVNTINFSTTLLVLELKWLLSGLLFVCGGIFLFMKKQAGWVICAATLLNFVVIIFSNIVTLSQAGALNPNAAKTMFGLVLLLAAFIFLFNRTTRKKFMVTNKSYLLTIGLYLVMLAMTYWV